MSRPGETDDGKGSFNRITNLKDFDDHFDEIDFGGHKIVYIEDGIGGDGYYVKYTETGEIDGPYNTYISARRNLD
jgi:hypothetical protein